MPPTLLPHHPHPALTSNPATSRPRPQPQPQPQLFITPPSAVYQPTLRCVSPQVKLSDTSELDGLMDEAAYKAFCSE